MTSPARPTTEPRLPLAGFRRHLVQAKRLAPEEPWPRPERAPMRPEPSPGPGPVPGSADRPRGR